MTGPTAGHRPATAHGQRPPADGPDGSRHRRQGRRSRLLGRWILIGLVLVVVAGGTLLVVSLRGRAPAIEPIEGGRDVMVLPVRPVGGQTPDGVQTRASAQAEVQSAADFGAAGVRVTADLSWLCGPDRRCDTAPLAPVVQRARQLGLQVYLQVNSTPSWMDRRGTWYAPVGEDRKSVV